MRFALMCLALVAVLAFGPAAFAGNCGGVPASGVVPFQAPSYGYGVQVQQAPVLVQQAPVIVQAAPAYAYGGVQQVPVQRSFPAVSGGIPSRGLFQRDTTPFTPGAGGINVGGRRNRVIVR